jgi:hypothetical protein
MSVTPVNHIVTTDKGFLFVGSISGVRDILKRAQIILVGGMLKDRPKNKGL